MEIPTASTPEVTVDRIMAGALDAAPLTRRSRERGHKLSWLANVIRLLRPGDTALAFLATFIGGRVAGLGSGHVGVVVGLAMSNLALSGASMAFNDWHDVAEDRLNKPDSPVASGRLPRAHALVLSVMLYVCGVAFAIVAHPVFGALAGVVMLLSCAYTLRLKRIPFVGNGFVALLSAYPFWCWLVVVGHRSISYVALCLGAILLCFGREIIRTAEDASGDAMCRIPTVATTLGVGFACRVGAVLVFLATVVAWLPLVRGDANATYAALLSVSMILVFRVCARARHGSVDRDCGKWRLAAHARWITVLMAAAFVAGLGPLL